MFKEYFLGEITLDQLINWVNEQITLSIKKEIRKEEVEL